MLQFIVAHEPTLIAFAENAGIAPAAVLKAMRALPQGDDGYEPRHELAPEMSDDPETARQIAELARDTRPLLVLDVDEVLLEFVSPFIGFLGSRALKFDTMSFRLHGNISDAATGAPVDNERVSALLDEFFGAAGRLANRRARRGRGDRRARGSMPRSSC